MQPIVELHVAYRSCIKEKLQVARWTSSAEKNGGQDVTCDVGYLDKFKKKVHYLGLKRV